MKACGMPNGVGDVGYGTDDVPALAESCLRQARALANAPRDIAEPELNALYAGALTYW